MHHDLWHSKCHKNEDALLECSMSAYSMINESCDHRICIMTWSHRQVLWREWNDNECVLILVTFSMPSFLSNVKNECASWLDQIVEYASWLDQIVKSSDILTDQWFVSPKKKRQEWVCTYSCRMTRMSMHSDWIKSELTLTHWSMIRVIQKKKDENEYVLILVIRMSTHHDLIKSWSELTLTHWSMIRVTNKKLKKEWVCIVTWSYARVI